MEPGENAFNNGIEQPCGMDTKRVEGFGYVVV